MNTIVLQLSDADADISMLQCSAQFRILIINSHFVVDNATHALASSATAKPTFIVEEEDFVIRNGWTPKEEEEKNDNKTNLMLVNSNRTKHLHSLSTSITIVNAHIPFKHSVMNLGLTLDCHLTMNAHVSNIDRTWYFLLRRLEFIRRFLTSTTYATLVSAYALS